MKDLNSSLSKFVIFFIICVFSVTFSQGTKPIIAVIHLDNDGGVSEPMIDTICDRITTLIEKTQRYYVFRREFITPVLEESRFTVLNGIYSLKEELAAAGALLSVDKVIGGIISRENGNLNLTLKLIDVHAQLQLSSVQFSRAVSKSEFMEIQLSNMVSELLGIK